MILSSFFNFFYNKKKLLNLNFVAFFVYFLVSFIYFALPIINHFTTCIIASATNDTTAPLQFLYWWPYSILHGINPFVSQYIWVPTGAPLALTFSISLISIILSPITLMFGYFTTYNIIAILAPVLAAFSTFLLCREFINKFFPSLIGGYIFGFSSYLLGQMIAHIAFILIFPIPLALYFIVKWFKNSLSNKLLIIALTAIFVFEFSSNLEIFATATFFGGLTFLLAFFILNKELKYRFLLLLQNIIISYVLTILIVLPYIFYLVKQWGAYPQIATPPSVFSVDLLNYIFPTKITYFGSKIFYQLSQSFHEPFVETGAYIGLPLIIIIIATTIKFFKNEYIKLISIITILIVVLSFGPKLHIEGMQLFNMPWLIFMKIPLIKGAMPDRFAMYVFLGAAMIVAFWLEKSVHQNYLKYLAGLIVVLSLLPNLSQGFWHSKIYTPLFFKKGYYKRYIKKNETVVIIPYSNNGLSMAWQVETHMYFRMAGGYVSTEPPYHMITLPWNRILYGGKIGWHYMDYIKCFFNNADVKAIIVAKNSNTTGKNWTKGFRRHWQYILRPLNWTEIKYKGVNIYLRHRKDIVKKCSFKSLQFNLILRGIEDLRIDSNLYALRNNGSYKGLNVLALKDDDILPKGWFVNSKNSVTPFGFGEYYYGYRGLSFYVGQNVRGLNGSYVIGIYAPNMTNSKALFICNHFKKFINGFAYNGKGYSLKQFSCSNIIKNNSKTLKMDSANQFFLGFRGSV